MVCDTRGRSLFQLVQSSSDIRDTDARITAVLSAGLKPYLGSTNPFSDSTCGASYQAVDVRKAIFEQEGSEPLFKTLSELFSLSVTQGGLWKSAAFSADESPARGDLVAVSAVQLASWCALGKQVQTLADECISLLAESQNICYGDDMPINEKLRRRRKDLEAVHWGLTLWPSDTLRLPYPVADEVEERLESRLAALTSNAIEGDEKQRLLDQTEWFLTPTFTASARYQILDGPTPAYRWTPRLTSHLIPGWPGKDLQRLPVLNFPEEVAEAPETHSIASELRMEQQSHAIKLAGDYSVVRDFILPTFEEYRDRIRAYVQEVESTSFTVYPEDQVYTRKLRAAFGLQCARHQAEKELKSALDLFQADCKTLTTRFKRRHASIEHKNTRRAFHCEMMYRLCKHGDQIYDLMESMGSLIDEMDVGLGDQSAARLVNKRKTLLDEAEIWKNELEKCHVDRIQEHLDDYTLADLIENMTKETAQPNQANGPIRDSHLHKCAPLTLPAHILSAITRSTDTHAYPHSPFSPCSFVLNTDAACESNYAPSADATRTRREDSSQHDFEKHFHWRSGE